jgi:hypothetical protein
MAITANVPSSFWPVRSMAMSSSGKRVNTARAIPAPAEDGAECSGFRDKAGNATVGFCLWCNRDFIQWMRSGVITTMKLRGAQNSGGSLARSALRIGTASEDTSGRGRFDQFTPSAPLDHKFCRDNKRVPIPDNSQKGRPWLEWRISPLGNVA